MKEITVSAGGVSSEEEAGDTGATEFWRLVGKCPLPRIHVLSDLHLEGGPYEIPPDLQFDILVAAGDIGPIGPAIEWLAALNKPVIYVLGNHEFWQRDFFEAVALARNAAQGTQVHVLERNSVVIKGVRFVGATLWTDYGSWHPDLVAAALTFMRDYSRISAQSWFASKSNQALFRRHCKRAGFDTWAIEEWIASGSFHPVIAYERHLKTVTWLASTLARKFHGPTVVVTHHAPTYDSLRALGISEFLFTPKGWRYRDDKLGRVACYASQLDDLLQHHSAAIDLWIHGHIHKGLDLLCQNTRVVCNPRGYFQPPLDEESARAFALLGYPVTQHEIERSQALHTAQPYRGDARDFDPRLVIDLTSGLERPIYRATKQPLATLRELSRDATELVDHLKGSRSPARKYLIRCLEQDFKAFNATLDTAIDPILRALGLHFPATTDKPPRPHPPRHNEEASTAAYARELLIMAAYSAWVDRLPTLAQTRLIEWANVSSEILGMLEASGVRAWMERLPAATLRQVGWLPHLVIANASEQQCKNWHLNLDKAFNKDVPRLHIFEVQGLMEIEMPTKADWLTLEELTHFTESSTNAGQAKVSHRRRPV